MTDDLDRLDERLTVLLAQQGERDVFGRLVDRHDRRLLDSVRRILVEPDGDLDLLQAVCLIVHRGPRKLNSPDAFRVWLYRIAHDQAVSELWRKTRRTVAFEETAVCEPLDDSAFENAEPVHVALRDLSVDHRRLLTLLPCPRRSVSSRA